MPRLYGESLNIVPKDGQSFEDAMLVKNSSVDSCDVDFGYDKLSDSDKEIVDQTLNEMKEYDKL